MSERDDDVITVSDAAGRRRFVRQSAGLLLAAGAVTRVGALQADTCDRNGSGASEKQATANSDSDANAGADPAGCPRKDTPKISRQDPSDDRLKAASSDYPPTTRIVG